MLKRKLTRAKLATRSFMDLSIEIESIINIRPITTVSTDHRERKLHAQVNWRQEKPAVSFRIVKQKESTKYRC